MSHTDDLSAALDAAAIACAVGITENPDGTHQFTDAYGVSYTGPPAHVMLSILARPDMSDSIFETEPDGSAVHAAALLLIKWFTSHGDRDLVHRFAALSASQICEFVVYLLRAGLTVLRRLSKVEADKLSETLLDRLAPDPTPGSPDTRGTTDAGQHGDGTLQIVASVPDADDAQVLLTVSATEKISWQVTTPVWLPADRINNLLIDPDELADYLEEDPDLLGEALAHNKSDTDVFSIRAIAATPRTCAQKAVTNASVPQAFSTAPNSQHLGLPPNQAAPGA